MESKTKNTNTVESFLTGRGYKVNHTALNYIREADAWYSNELIEGFHERKNLNNVKVTVPRTGFAKRCCADDANLCEIISINASENDDVAAGIQKILDDSKFDKQYRKQLEQMSACGTVGIYVRLDNAVVNEKGKAIGGDIKLNYVDPAGIIPLTVINDEVVECAFTGVDLVDGKEIQTLVIFTLDNRQYTASTYTFQDGKQTGETEDITFSLGDVKPFSVLHTAEVNNLKGMQGYGFPKIYGAIPELKAVDLCMEVFTGDLSKADKIVLIDELLAEFQRDENGKPFLTPQQKEIFILAGTGEKLPDEKSLIHEYNPVIRIDAVKASMELALSLLSMKFGYGTKRYSFERNAIQTATQYIGERQDMMQDLNKQRFESTAYITDIVKAVVWFSNEFHGTSWSLNDEIKVDYDDSYIMDRQTVIEQLYQQYVATGLEFVGVKWLCTQFNITADEAKVALADGGIEIDDGEDGVE